MRSRIEVAFRTILLLRVTMDVLEWSSGHRDAWDVLSPPEKEPRSGMLEQHFANNVDYRHGQRTLVDENFRAIRHIDLPVVRWTAVLILSNQAAAKEAAHLV